MREIDAKHQARIALWDYVEIVLKSYLGVGEKSLLFATWGGGTMHRKSSSIVTWFFDVSIERGEKRMERADELAAGVLNAFKWEVVYRRALAMSRGENESNQVWRVFAAYANRKHELAVKAQDELLWQYRDAAFRY